jgi:hypothetical protein
MEPTAILAIIEGALTILEKAAPWVAQAVKQGTITPARQQQLYDRVQALQSGGPAFNGPEWKPSGL